ncbi:hypothetical protein [Rhodococcus opacus]|uniref:Uncharacterized protein n=1 Tax=Rhodococcus opacus TaxID=37919 RepID=A0A2S8IRE3_RHOOP|nr:hypothetical protein [Rhodococcus opacus]PQP17259.1 hypothetical protein C5613_34610 [Rhodococcus opacus]
MVESIEHGLSPADGTSASTTYRLGEGLDDLGVPEGQPFLISPAGVYDVALNRVFLGVAGVFAVEHPGRPCPGPAHVLRLPVVRARQAGLA